MSEIIVGRQPVVEALKAGTPIEKIVLLYGVKGNAIERIRQLAKQRGIAVAESNRQRFRELAEDATTQGVVALVATKDYIEVEDILAAARKRGEPCFILVLDEIEDPHNVGALIRSAEAAGAHGVIITKHHSAMLNQTVAKTSAGASVHLPAAKVTNLAQTIDELKRAGLWIVGTTPESEKLYTEVDYKSPVAVVVGSEGKGMRKLISEKCDFLVRIPMYGKIDSLNASVAGALVMFEVARARRS
ncbi:MAG: 23S rRNA (guanosine(2251)-2'-O)-methyltransferase RlmB [Ignavibacteria bacterium]|nr:23S rRNA (guanosine(2251)-2'-O)-methyltransferase RlmB [Ignavibacteria bacterium]